MNPKRLIPIILVVFGSHACCMSQGRQNNPYATVGAIPLPAGYIRIPAEKNSFAAWLRAVPLKKNRTVYLYDGSPKPNQDAQFAVLDVSVNDPGIQPGVVTAPPQLPPPAAYPMRGRPKDLQQCADAIMRLRAEYLYSLGDFDHIDFYTGQGTRLNFAEWLKGRRYRVAGGRLIACAVSPGRMGANRDARRSDSLRKIFGEYLQTVFAYCGTLSLEKQLDPLSGQGRVEIGDVLIHGGSPGHAMLVMDMATGPDGQKIYMLSQGYMPAQDIHIVRNTNHGSLTPWYPLDGKTIYTPEYTFDPKQWKTWRPLTFNHL